MRTLNKLAWSTIASIPILASIYYITTKTDNNYQLVNVHVIHRHGDRVPVSILNENNVLKETAMWTPFIDTDYWDLQKSKDMYSWSVISSRLQKGYIMNSTSSNNEVVDAHNAYHWFGKLTHKGTNEMYEFGRYIRQMYLKHFNNNLNEEDVYCQSTNFARTIHSADCVLRGLFDDNDNNKRVPIHIGTKKTLIYPNQGDCRKLAKNVEANREYVKMNMDPQFIDLKVKIGEYYDIENPIDVYWNKFADGLMCRFAHNIDLPASDELSSDELWKYINYIYQRMSADYALTKETLSLSIGALLDKIINYRNTNGKLVIMSVHDTTIIALLCALTTSNGENIKQIKWPKYGASVIIELWENSDKFYIRILYDKQAYLLNGNEFTELNKLKTMWSDLLIDQDKYWNSKCLSDV